MANIEEEENFIQRLQSMKYTNTHTILLRYKVTIT